MLPVNGWQKEIPACAKLLPAIQQRLPQLLGIQRLGQIPCGIHLVALQGHLPVAENKDDGLCSALLPEYGGKGHAVLSVHHHIQQEYGKGRAFLHSFQQRLSVFKAVDLRVQSLLPQDFPS